MEKIFLQQKSTQVDDFAYLGVHFFEFYLVFYLSFVCKQSVIGVIPEPTHKVVDRTPNILPRTATAR